MEVAFEAELWRWRAEEGGSWHFVAVPPDLADDVRVVAGPPRGFGSVRVEAVIGGSTWRTSLFPDSARGTYVLPVKKAVREMEGLDEGATCEVALRVL